MYRSFVFVGTLALAFCVTSTEMVNAQRGGGGRGGFGGFQPGGGSSASALLMRKEVQEELELSKSQISEIEDSMEEINEARNESRQEMMEKMRELRDLPQEERGEAMRELFAEAQKSTEKLEKGLVKVLVGDQADRFNQIKLQVETRVRGNDPVAQAKALLRNAAVQKELGIDEDQAEKIEENDKAKKVAEEVQKEISEVMAEGTDKILLEFISKKQLEKLHEMMGARLELSNTQQGRGGQQGRGQQGRGGQQQGRGGQQGGRQRPNSEDDF